MDIESRVQTWAQTRPDIRAVIVVGSRARTRHHADEWSDLDLCLFVTEREAFVEADFYKLFGEVWLAAYDTTGFGDPEWVVMFEGGMKVDFTFVQADADAPTLADAMMRLPYAETFSRGIRALVDKYPRRDRTPPASSSARLPTPAEFDNTVNHFYLSASRAVKYIRRGDHWRSSTVTMCQMRAKLMQMIEWHARANNPTVDTWYNGRFVEDWADARIVDKLRDIYADDDPSHRAKAIFAQMALFAWVADETAALIGHTVPDVSSAVGWIDSVGKRLLIVPTETQISAGGVVYRNSGRGTEIALVRVGDRWQLPKGIIDDGEETEATAQREVREEAGVDAAVIGLIDRIEYWYYTSIGRGKKRIHKFVFFYLMRYISGDPADHDHEVDEAGWFPLDEIETLVPFRGEAAILAKAREMLAAENAQT